MTLPHSPVVFAQILGAKCVLLEDSKVLLTEGSSGTEQLTFLAAVPTVMSLARVPSAVRHVDVAGEALTEAVTANLRRAILPSKAAPLTASHPPHPIPLPRRCSSRKDRPPVCCAARK